MVSGSSNQDDVKQVWNITRRFRVLNMGDFEGGLGDVRFPPYFNQHNQKTLFDIQGDFVILLLTVKLLKYGKPRLGESMLT